LLDPRLVGPGSTLISVDAYDQGPLDTTHNLLDKNCFLDLLCLRIKYCTSVAD